MALQVWLPLNGDLHNQGLGNYQIISNNITFINTGKIGQCANFNGTNSYIYINNFILGNSWSYGCWINTPNSDSRGWEIVIILNNTGSDADSQLAFWVHQKENRFESLANTQYNSSISYTPYYNSWHHFFATFNGEILKTYIDGIVVNTRSITKEQYVGTNLTIGARCTNTTGTTFTSYFQGQLNDVRIYNHCLSDKEVKEISKGLVLHYQLNNGNPNLLSEYVAPGSGAPGSTSTGGRTNYYGKYGIIIPATENADTYFRLFLKQQLVQGTTYTISCYVSGLLPGSRYNFPLFAQGNTSMGVLQLNHNGLCSLTFTMNSSSQNAVTTPEGDTVYVCFMDDLARTLASGQGAITVNGFKLEQGSNVTNFSSIDNDIIYDVSGYNHNGEIINTVSVEIPSPKNNVSLHMSATNQKVKITGLTTTGFNNSYSFAWWEKISSTDPMHWGFADGVRLNGMYTGHLWNTGDGSSNPLYKPGTTTQVSNSTVNVWHHWVMTGDGSKCKVYQDGVLWGEAKTYKTISGTTIYINGWDAGTSYCSNNASMSDFRIYATALTPAQIKELYETSKIVDGTTVKARDLEVSA